MTLLATFKLNEQLDNAFNVGLFTLKVDFFALVSSL